MVNLAVSGEQVITVQYTLLHNMFKNHDLHVHLVIFMPLLHVAYNFIPVVAHCTPNDGETSVVPCTSPMLFNFCFVHFHPPASYHTLVHTNASGKGGNHKTIS